jgi:hypothetical protein
MAADRSVGDPPKPTATRADSPTVCAQAANQHARPSPITAMGARRQAESGQEKSSQAPLRPDAPPQDRPTEYAHNILLTFSKGIFFHEDLGS